MINWEIKTKRNAVESIYLARRYTLNTNEVNSSPVIFFSITRKALWNFYKHHKTTWPVDSRSWFLVTHWSLNSVFFCCLCSFSRDSFYGFISPSLCPCHWGETDLQQGLWWPHYNRAQGPVRFPSLVVPHPLRRICHMQPSLASQNASWPQLLTPVLRWARFPSLSAIYLLQTFFPVTPVKAAQSTPPSLHPSPGSRHLYLNWEPLVVSITFSVRLPPALPH